MLLKKKIIPAMLGAFVSLGLVACGGDSDSTVGVGGVGGVDPTVETTGNTPTGSSVNSAQTIALTYPITDAIENLGAGVYRRVASAVVTDNEGNPVPDGTEVFLSVIDSVIAQGTIDSISGAVLTDTSPTFGDGKTATTLDQAYVVRNEALHFIDPGDHVFLVSNDPFNLAPADSKGNANAEGEDKNRVVSSAGGSVTANTITVTTNYAAEYPNSNYPADTTEYVVGTSASGVDVLGTNAEGEYVNEGFATTLNGLAKFYITYPANIHTIQTGCGNVPSIDERTLPVGAARVYLVASAGTEATTIDQRFCFPAIGPDVLFSAPSKLSTTGGDVSLWVEDSGDRIPIPYLGISGYAVIEEGDFTVTFTDADGNSSEGSIGLMTNRWGNTSVNVNVVDNSGGVGGKLAIEFSSGDGSVVYDITVKDTTAP